MASEFTKACEALNKKISDGARPGRKPSCAYSKGDLDNLAHALVNSPDYTYSEYSMKTDENGKPIKVEKSPSKRYRDSLKPTLKSLGLEKEDVDKIDDMQFNKEHASAIVGLASIAIKESLLAGRKYQFPMTSDKEARMEIFTGTCPERISTNTIAARKDNPAPLKTTRTAEHTILKTKKKVPSWLKKTID